jgi:regulator of protease activity HflC (stomatin/prohibitin superfamily)
VAVPGIVLVALVVVGAMILLTVANLKRIRPNENGVVLAFGAYRRTLGPGYYVLNPFRHLIRVDMGTRSASIPSTPLSAANGAPVAVGARLEYRVVDAGKSVFGAPDLPGAVLSALRDSTVEAISRTSAAALSTTRGAVADSVRTALVERVVKLGVEVVQVSINITGPGDPGVS